MCIWKYGAVIGGEVPLWFSRADKSTWSTIYIWAGAEAQIITGHGKQIYLLQGVHLRDPREGVWKCCNGAMCSRC